MEEHSPRAIWGGSPPAFEFNLTLTLDDAYAAYAISLWSSVTLTSQYSTLRLGTHTSIPGALAQWGMETPEAFSPESGLLTFCTRRFVDAFLTLLES